jgi:tRNA nucleotidyltransferase (CCA-adding enzyme)
MERIKFDLDIPNDIKNINQVFKENGFKLFIVGGAVRDALLGETPKDFDLATDAIRFVTIATGKAFGVINVFTESGEFEIATFRTDQYKADDLEGFENYLKSLNNGSYEEFINKLMK